jgi:hypothetical protein
MYVGKDFGTPTGPFTIGELRTFSLDFSDQLSAGETLTAVTWTLTSLSDSSASSRLGSASFTAGGLATTQVTLAVAGTYIIEASATTSASNTPALWSRIPVAAVPTS